MFAFSPFFWVPESVLFGFRVFRDPFSFSPREALPRPWCFDLTFHDTHTHTHFNIILYFLLHWLILFTPRVWALLYSFSPTYTPFTPFGYIWNFWRVFSLSLLFINKHTHTQIHFLNFNKRFIEFWMNFWFCDTKFWIGQDATQWWVNYWYSFQMVYLKILDF